ncbi:MAG: S-layer homology domain-containing protein [Syntrophomonadaceae bacterium]|nr:S-layer homology domain-containing protein [Syntrophomonadaceae bacterium]
MKRYLKKQFVVALIMALCLLTGTASAAGYPDLEESDWAYNYAAYAVEKGIMELDGNGCFNPGREASRGEFVLYLWRSLGCPEAPDGVIYSAPVFSDVNPGDPWFDAAEWAVQAGITSGTSSTTFSPGLALNREQAFTFLYNALPQFGADQGNWDMALTSFKDYGDVSSWARVPLNALYNVGIVSGTNDGYLMPLREMNNAAVSAVLYNTLQSVYRLEESGPQAPEQYATLYFIVNGAEKTYEMRYYGKLTPEKLMDGLTALTGLRFSYTSFDVVGDELRVHWAEDASFMPAGNATDTFLEEKMGYRFFAVDSLTRCMLDSTWATLSRNMETPRIYFTGADNSGLDLREIMNWAISGDEWYSGNFDDYYVAAG